MKHDNNRKPRHLIPFLLAIPLVLAAVVYMKKAVDTPPTPAAGQDPRTEAPVAIPDTSTPASLPVAPETISIVRPDTTVRDSRPPYEAGYEDGYQHRATVHGDNFSGGQKQRLLISRALAVEPEILILDDASSALDYQTDASVRKAIREHHGDTTTIIVAQRISSIRNLDQIIMLEEGRILGHGTHAELMETCPAYRDIYEAQMGEGELGYAD